MIHLFLARILYTIFCIIWTGIDTNKHRFVIWVYPKDIASIRHAIFAIVNAIFVIVNAIFAIVNAIFAIVNVIFAIVNAIFAIVNAIR
jgi:hypothetical protein